MVVDENMTGLKNFMGRQKEMAASTPQIGGDAFFIGVTVKDGATASRWGGALPSSVGGENMTG
ncbi:MAG: hypothetical protein IJ668_05540 [Selenomonadaceae bacterium]|nr:hypothetical protein [Selenomonadaceae bacterium]